MTPKVLIENRVIFSVYIPIVWWGDNGEFHFGGLLDFGINDCGPNRFISVTVLGLKVQIRVKLNRKDKNGSEKR